MIRDWNEFLGSQEFNPSSSPFNAQLVNIFNYAKDLPEGMEDGLTFNVSVSVNDRGCYTCMSRSFKTSNMEEFFSRLHEYILSLPQQATIFVVRLT